MGKVLTDEEREKRIAEDIWLSIMPVFFSKTFLAGRIARRSVFLVLREEIEFAHYNARAFGYRRKRVVRKRDRKPGLLRDELIEPAQLGAAAGEHYAAVDKVGGKFRFAVSKGYSHGIHN